MNSRFKFPHRVRIHGGECGAVARALHHEAQKDALMSYERAFLCQADSGKALGSTIERKSMSTKTTLKRIALVAVSALGFGLMTSVAPATAAAGTGSTISSVVVGTVPTARVGESVTIPITINTAAATASTETVILAVKVTGAPSVNAGNTATSVLSADNATGTNTAALGARLYASTNANGSFPSTHSYAGLTASTARGTAPTGSYTGGFVVGTTTAGDLTTGGASRQAAAAVVLTNDAADSSMTGYITIQPDVAGSYSVLVSATSWVGTDGSHMSFVAGDKSASFTVTAGSTGPSTVTLTRINSSHPASSTNGSLIRVNLNGTLSGDEAINVTVSTGRIAKASVSGGNFTTVAPTATTTARMTKADFVNNIGFVNVLGTAAGTITVTAASDGGLPSFSTSTTVTVGTAVSLAASTFAANDGTVIAAGAGQWKAGTSPAYTISATRTSSTVVCSFTDPAATKYTGLRVTDVQGEISGAPGRSNSLSYNMYSSVASGDTYKSFTISHAALGVSSSYDYSITCDGVTPDTTYQVSGAAAVGTTITATPSSIRGAAAGSVTIRAQVLDQFGSPLTASSTTVTVAGRNAARASETLITDATGYVSTTITDSGTASATDTVTFTNNTTGTASITWGTYTVGTVTVTGGKTASDSYKGQNTTTINTAKAGPDGSSVAITATVKDADGNVLAGVPVTFTVSKGLVRKTATTDFTTVVTGATGTATSYVIDWTEGEQVITATAGGKSGTDYLTWSQTTATSARSISGVASGNKVTATVKDRFGNTVKGVTVTAKTDLGYFGTGTNSTTGITDVDGNVSFFVSGASGAANVTLSLDKDTYTQSIDVAGEVDAAAVTAAVAGTTVGTGASLAAAGVNSVVVAVTATDAAAAAADAAADAAAEAIDAANAATDAANLAAEAADAATVAAEEARDAADAATAAVEELATQVATLMAALKAQITTLANTVAKIAKKVKA